MRVRSLFAALALTASGCVGMDLADFDRDELSSLLVEDGANSVEPDSSDVEAPEVEGSETDAAPGTDLALETEPDALLAHASTDASEREIRATAVDQSPSLPDADASTSPILNRTTTSSNCLRMSRPGTIRRRNLRE